MLLPIFVSTNRSINSFDLKKTLLLLSLIFLFGCESGNITESKKQAFRAFNEGKYEEVVTLLQQLPDEGPQNAVFHLIKGRSHYKLKRMDLALVHIHRAIRLDPGSGEAYMALAEVQAFQQEYEKAFPNVQQALELVPDNPEFLFRKGSILSSANLPDEAIASYSQALTLSPEMVDAYLYRGFARIRRQLFSEAIEDFSAVLERDSTNSTAIINRGFCYLETAQFAEAEQDFSFAIESAPTDRIKAAALNNRGYARYKLDSLALATEDITQSIELDGKNPYAFRNRALIEIAENNPQTACQSLAKSAELGFAKNFGNEVDSLMSVYCN